MSLAVFLGPVTDARAGDVVVVEGDEARHAVVVRRTAAGEQVVLADGAGTAATCTVTATTKTTLTATVDDVVIDPRLPVALEGLSSRQRSAVLLVHAHGYGLTEAAAVLGVSVSALRNHLSRGLRHLRASLGEPDDD